MTHGSWVERYADMSIRAPKVFKTIFPYPICPTFCQTATFSSTVASMVSPSAPLIRFDHVAGSVVMLSVCLEAGLAYRRAPAQAG